MPHNKPCPVCGCLVPDWHWEWHTEPGYGDIYRGSAGMECPVCGALVMFAGASALLTSPPPGSQVRRVRRDVTKAAVWSKWSNAGMPLSDYLTTAPGQLYANYWTSDEVQQADQQAAAQP